MIKVYVVMVSQGEYDDYSQWMLRGFISYEKAEAAIVEEKTKDVRYNSLVKPARDAFRVWFSENPFKTPESLLLGPKMEKGWKSKDVTPEFKTEQNRVRQENEARSGRNHKAQAEWNNRAEAASRQILVDLGATKEELEMFVHPVWTASNRDYSYDIEELEVE
jgi:hypothetical protein